MKKWLWSTSSRSNIIVLGQRQRKLLKCFACWLWTYISPFGKNMITVIVFLGVCRNVVYIDLYEISNKTPMHFHKTWKVIRVKRRKAKKNHPFVPNIFLLSIPLWVIDKVLTKYTLELLSYSKVFFWKFQEVARNLEAWGESLTWVLSQETCQSFLNR